MPRTHDVIRLVGGPPKVDGSVCNLGLSDRDRADAADGQFVRAMKGSTVTSLTGLQARCVDRRHAHALAADWRALLYRPRGGRRPGRPRVYQFEGYYMLEARRDGRGRWGVEVCAQLTGSNVPPPPPTTTVWSALELAVDDASGRFASVAALVPPGPLAERALAARHAIGSCVCDAARLCAVGEAISPSGGGEVFTDQTVELIGRVTALVRTIDTATAQLVDLHLEVSDARDPVEPLTGLAESWAELTPTLTGVDDTQ